MRRLLLVLFASSGLLLSAAAFAQEQELDETVIQNDPVVPEPPGEQVDDPGTDSATGVEIPDPFANVEPLPQDVVTPPEPPPEPTIFDLNSRAINRAEQNCNVGDAC
ncbi:hypothetical protein [Mesorhizobium sp. M0195]|uniref:hypothetical protein n=1 Tax=Mesorhizobium sp. M0195 TaxID=2956910 RepID=UPI00333B0BD8